MQRIKNCLWFDHQAEEAARFYTKIFKKSKIGTITRYGKTGPLPEGTVLTVQFWLEGQEFLALNGGPVFEFNESISLVVEARDQKELDTYWRALLKGGGTESQCGWLKDRYGLSWQVVPAQLARWMNPRTPSRASAVMTEILKMRKLDIRKLEAAYATKPPPRTPRKR